MKENHHSVGVSCKGFEEEFLALFAAIVLFAVNYDLVYAAGISS